VRDELAANLLPSPPPRSAPSFLGRSFCVDFFFPFFLFGSFSVSTEQSPVDSKPTNLRSISVDAETFSTLQSSTAFLSSFRCLLIEYSLLQPRSAPEDASPPACAVGYIARLCFHTFFFLLRLGENTSVLCVSLYTPMLGFFFDPPSPSPPPPELGKS